MKKTIYKNIIVVSSLTIMLSAVYILLLHHSYLSISAIANKADYPELKPHLLMAGLLPIYIAMIIFGFSTLAIYLGMYVKKSLFLHQIKPTIKI